MDREISITKKFKCLGAACPDTCCKGWQILVDDTTYEAAKSVKGLRGLTLRMGIKRFPERVIKMKKGVCPFLRDGLCSHEAEGNLALQPTVCKVFPRRVMWFGGELEETLELACPEVARLFLENGAELVPAEHKIVSHSPMRYSEEEIFKYLYAVRDFIVGFVSESDQGTGRLIDNVIVWAHETHFLILTDRMEEIRYKVEASGARDVNVLSHEVINRVVHDFIAIGRYRYENQKLKKLLALYEQFLLKCTDEEFEAYLRSAQNALGNSCPGLKNKYNAYFSYALVRLMPFIGDNYLLLDNVLLAAIYTKLLMAFDAALILAGETPDVKNQALYISAYEKRVWHNTSISADLSDFVRELSGRACNKYSDMLFS